MSPSGGRNEQRKRHLWGGWLMCACMVHNTQVHNTQVRNTQVHNTRYSVCLLTYLPVELFTVGDSTSDSGHELIEL